MEVTEHEAFPKAETSDIMSKEMVGKEQLKRWGGEQLLGLQEAHITFSAYCELKPTTKYPQACKGKEQQTLWVRLGAHSMHLKQPT